MVNVQQVQGTFLINAYLQLHFQPKLYEKLFRALIIRKTTIMISIHIVKLCDDAICESLGMIFNKSLISGSFPYDWKKA